MTHKDTKFSKGNEAANGEAVGKSNGRRTVMTDALMKALHEEVSIVEGGKKKTKRLALIATKLAKKAQEGDVQAIKEIFDRTQGKAMQAMEHSGPEGGPMETKWIVEVVDAKSSDTKED